MTRVLRMGMAIAVGLLFAVSAMAGSASSASSGSWSGARVPELDGGMALLALALTAAIVAIIREKRRG